MSRVQVHFSPDGQIEAQLELDLTRALGGATGFHAASLHPSPLRDPELLALSRQIASAMQLEFLERRIAWQAVGLTFSSQLLDDYESSVIWPRATLTLVGREQELRAGADPLTDGPFHQTVQIFLLRFSPDFLFEEPIAVTVSAVDPVNTESTLTMSRWLVVDQRFPVPRPELLEAIDPQFRSPLVAMSVDRESATGLDRPTFLAFLRVGFTHVFPGGWDHLAFVLGLLLLASSLRATLGLLTVYTLGHTVSYLAMALRWIPQPGPWAETIILVSVFWVGWAIWRTKANAGQRLSFVELGGVLVFGLVHGLGFASALGVLPTERHQLLSAIFGFNLGIEAAQLAAALAAGSLLLIPIQGQALKVRYRRIFGGLLMSAPVVALILRS